MKRYIILIILFIMLVVGFVAFNKAYSNEDSTVKKMFSNEKYAKYKSGDLVSFKGEEWYVLHDSSDKDNYVTLIYKGVLYLEEEGLSNTIYKVYESSDLNSYFKNDYLKSLGDDNLREVNGYKIRLFNQDDMRRLLETTYDEKTDSYDIKNCPDFICLTNVYYATMIPTNTNKDYDVSDIDSIEDYNIDEYKVHINYYNLDTTYDTYNLNSIVSDVSLFVRPVINVYKERLDK